MRSTSAKSFFPASPITIRLRLSSEQKSFGGKQILPLPLMYSTIKNVAESPPRSLSSLRLPFDSSSSSSSAASSSIDSYSSKGSTTTTRTRKQLLLPPPPPPPNIKIDNSSRHARSQSFPVDVPLKNDLFVPPPDAHHAIKQKQKRKHKRERKTAAGAVGGMVVGGLAFGPVGVAVGAAVGGFTTRQIAKKAEKRSQRRREQRSFRDFATSKAIQWSLNGEAAVFT